MCVLMRVAKASNAASAESGWSHSLPLPLASESSEELMVQLLWCGCSTGMYSDENEVRMCRYGPASIVAAASEPSAGQSTCHCDRPSTVVHSICSGSNLTVHKDMKVLHSPLEPLHSARLPAQLLTPRLSSSTRHAALPTCARAPKQK